MVQSRIYENLPFFVRLEDKKNGGAVEHLCDQGIQPTYDEILRLLSVLDSAFDPRFRSSVGMIDDIAKNLGMQNFEDHWVGIGLNPNWSFEKKREVVERIYDYYRKKGTIESLKEAVKIWGVDEVENTYPFKVSEDVVIANTTNHRSDRIGLWSYYTPFNFNYLRNLPSQRRLGVGDRWEKSRDYVDDSETKMIVTSYVWDNLTIVDNSQMILGDNESIPASYTLRKLFRFKGEQDQLTHGENSKKRIAEVTVENKSIPVLSTPQRTGLWDKDILISLEIEKELNEDISQAWETNFERMSPLLWETMNITIAHQVLYHIVSKGTKIINKPSVDHELTGDIATDYPQLLDYYDAQKIKLKVTTSTAERTLRPKNIFWKSLEGEKNYYMGVHLLGVNGYEYPIGEYKELNIEFSLVSTATAKEDFIAKWSMEIGEEVIEEIEFENPINFKSFETLYLTFRLNIDLEV